MFDKLLEDGGGGVGGGGGGGQDAQINTGGGWGEGVSDTKHSRTCKRE